MFSQVEENYIKGLIGSYYREGYNYYLGHTVTESNNDYDIYIYFSKEEIKAVTSNSFSVKNGILIKIDSSSRNDNTYNPSTHSRVSLIDNSFTDVVSIHEAEFIYTNANIDYKTSAYVVQPDINFNGYTTFSVWTSMSTLFVLVILLVYTFVRDILRIRK